MDRGSCACSFNVVCTVVQISTDERPNYWWTAIFLGRDGEGAMKARRV